MMKVLEYRKSSSKGERERTRACPVLSSLYLCASKCIHELTNSNLVFRKPRNSRMPRWNTQPVDLLLLWLEAQQETTGHTHTHNKLFVSSTQLRTNGAVPQFWWAGGWVSGSPLCLHSLVILFFVAFASFCGSWQSASWFFDWVLQECDPLSELLLLHLLAVGKKCRF